MSNDKNNQTSNFMTGIIVGSIVGAATALLIAPKSGKELRSDINEQVEALKEKRVTGKKQLWKKGLS
ncbi:YtxH domain-containing protein [Bacillus sp. N9]